MVLKEIRTINLQNHKDVIIELPPTGLIVFTGDNSNGKSVIVRATEYILLNRLTRPRKRASLVNRNATFGEIIYTRDDDTRLTVHIQREAAGTWFEYAEPDKEPVKRYLSDKSYTELVRLFGWHVDNESGLSLNIAQEEDPLLFYKTSYKTNCSLIETATSDAVADRVLANIEETLKETRQNRDNFNTIIKVNQEALSALKIEDTAPLINENARLERLLRNLEAVRFPVIPEIQPVPKVKYVDVKYPELPNIKYPRIIDIKIDIPDITQIATDLKALKERRCPTCGRRFDDAGTHTMC